MENQLTITKDTDIANKDKFPDIRDTNISDYLYSPCSRDSGPHSFTYAELLSFLQEQLNFPGCNNKTSSLADELSNINLGYDYLTGCTVNDVVRYGITLEINTNDTLRNGKLCPDNRYTFSIITFVQDPGIENHVPFYKGKTVCSFQVRVLDKDLTFGFCKAQGIIGLSKQLLETLKSPNDEHVPTNFNKFKETYRKTNEPLTQLTHDTIKNLKEIKRQLSSGHDVSSIVELLSDKDIDLHDGLLDPKEIQSVKCDYDIKSINIGGVDTEYAIAVITVNLVNKKVIKLICPVTIRETNVGKFATILVREPTGLLKSLKIALVEDRDVIDFRDNHSQTLRPYKYFNI